VRALGERLERAGLTVILDQFAQEREFHGGGPDEGWPPWCVNQAGGTDHKILIIASSGWFRCYEGKEVSGTGLGAAAEAGVIRQRLYNAAGINPDIRIVAFEALASHEVPLDLQRYHRFQDPADFANLVAWLTGAAPAPPPMTAADWPDAPPALDWPVADHGPVRDAFGQLLTQRPPWRCLLIRGDSETGKSHLTRLMLGGALGLPGLACGRFDFKGATGVEAELQSFVMNLDVAPPAGGTLSERLGRVLAGLRQRARPALLIFDTYEQACEAQDWVEKQLLPAILRAPWLRVVIAGQRAPNRTGAPWAAGAAPVLQLVPPPPEDWFAFGQPHKPGLTLKFVREAHKHCQGKASLLAQLLGPAT
jgi:hypothetical protein